MNLIWGLLFGIVFGALLQHAEVLRYERQVGAMRLLDMTIVKFMLSTIIVAAFGIHLLRSLGVVEFTPRNLSLGAQIIGGLLFGIGWAITGYCPGTSVGAVGEGRFHAAWPILGMLIGGLLFVFIYPLVQNYIQPLGEMGAMSLPQALDISYWWLLLVLVACSLLLFGFFEHKRL